jgi:hypothetical protein
MAISYTLLVDWNDDGDFTNPEDDITGDTITVSWYRGRNYASALEGKSVAGKLTASLVNTDGKYSPSNTSSALSGSILPGRSVRITAGEAQTFPQDFPIAFSDTVRWQGKLDRILPQPASQGVKTCTLTAFGNLGYLNQFEVQLTSQTNRRTDQAVGDILDNLGWPSGDRSLDTGLTTISRFWIAKKKGIDALRLVEETEAGFIKETKDGKIGFENRHHRLTTSTSTTSQATFSDASDATNTYSSISQADPLSTIVNHVEATARTYNTASVAVLWTHPETGSDSPTLAPAEAKTFEAEFPNPDSANNAEEVDAWTTPAATTDYLANTSSDGSGTNRTSNIAVTNTKTAERMVMTFTNNSGDDVYLTKIQGRGTAVATKNPCTVRSIDTVSQAEYGERKYVAKTKFIPTTSEAQDWCDYQSSIYGSPVEILTMNVPSDETSIRQVLSRDISDRITVTADNDSKLGISADFFIESESHKVSVGGSEHTVQLKLSPASGGYSQFWVLGTSILGSETVPAF